MHQAKEANHGGGGGGGGGAMVVYTVEREGMYKIAVHQSTYHPPFRG